ncbi:MAG: deoxyhypusine synthase [Candidatus Aenigmatarchaeota archaeon]
MTKKIGIDIWKDMEISELVNEFNKTGFNAKRVNEAAEIYKKMLADKKCYKVLTIAGALVSAGMRKTFVKAIENKLVDCIICTGAILTHDLIEAFGIYHEPGSPDVDDAKLAKKNIDRLYDVFLPDKGYQILEKRLQKILPLMSQQKISPNQFLKELGKYIEDEESIIRAAWKNNIPIFCPAITDSILGFQTWMWGQDHDLKIYNQDDIRDFQNIVHEQKKFGMVILGGGVPKNFGFIMMQVSGKSLDYAIQITMDRPEHGGLSGAPLREAKSWKKISAKANIVDVICDATIAWPMILGALL